MDKTFPRSGRITDSRGRTVRDWERIPTAIEVLRAIREATKKF
jgi:hypothetical protein